MNLIDLILRIFSRVHTSKRLLCARQKKEGCESSLLSAGSATNQSLKFMPPLNKKGLEEKKRERLIVHEKSDVREETLKKRQKERRKSQEVYDF